MVLRFVIFNILSLTIKTFTKMTIEERKKAVKEACENMQRFCETYKLDLFMVVAANEIDPSGDGIRQHIGGGATGNAHLLSIAVAKSMLTEPRICKLILKASVEAYDMRAAEKETQAPDMSTDVYMN